MKTVRRASAALALALVLAGCASTPAKKPRDPGPTRTCPGCGAQIIDPDVKKCPTCDYPLGH